MVEVFIELGSYSCPSDLDSKHASGYGDAGQHYRKIDGAMCKALQQLWQADPPSAAELNKWAKDLKGDAKHRDAYGVEGYMTCSITLLATMWRITALRIKASKSLQHVGQSLPPEVVANIWQRLLQDVGYECGNMRRTKYGHAVPSGKLVIASSLPCSLSATRLDQAIHDEPAVKLPRPTFVPSKRSPSFNLPSFSSFFPQHAVGMQTA